MGGENESVIEGGSKKKSTAANQSTVISEGQQIRQHVSGTECHFHDDAAGLKVAIAIGDWWAIINGLKKGKQQLYFDFVNETKLTLKPTMSSKGKFDILINIKPAKKTKRAQTIIGLTPTV